MLAAICVGSGCESLSPALARSGQQFAEEIGGEFIGYVEADPTLTAEEVARRVDRVEAQKALWAQVLAAQEARR